MRQKKIGLFLVIMLLSFLLFDVHLKAETVSQDEVVDYAVNLLDWEAIEDAESQLRAALPHHVEFDLKTEMKKMMQGEAPLTVKGVLDYLIKALFNEVGIFVQFGARFVLIVLLCNLLQTLSSSFKAKEITKIGFFVCYMTILLSVVQSFQVMIELAIQTIEQLEKIMLICIPTLLAFMATTGFAVSAGTMAPIIITSLSLMSYLIKVIILPCIISVVVLEVVSAMSSEFKVDKLIGLFYKGIKWGLRGILTLSVSLLGFYRLVMPGVDVTVKKATVKFSTAFIPVVGSAVGGTIDFITQGASLVRNSFSAGVVIWLLILVSLPMIKLLAYVLVYQIAGAVIEPIGDKKMAHIATKLGKGSQFIMSCVGIVALFCICSLIICMTIGAGGA